MTVTTAQIDRYREGYDAFFAGLGLYAVDSDLYQLGWLDAEEAWQVANQREKALRELAVKS